MGESTGANNLDTQSIGDSYVNFAANIGLGTDNLSSYGTYGFSWLTKNRILLEALYRGSWVIGAAIDMQADDMTQAGIEINSTLKPDQIDELTESFNAHRIWPAINATIKWSRLYGSAVGVYMIDGQDMSTPLRIDTVGKDQFKGVLPMDRWQLIPSISDLVSEFGPDIGTPKYYQTVPDAILPNLGRIHHTRLFRLDAIELPHYQKMTENMWAESVVERIFDRLEAFDSTTQGAAQLVFKAYLRTLKVKKLREIMAAGGIAMQNLEKNVGFIRRFQSSEGLTLLDAEDEMESAKYGFEGLDDILMQFGQQLAGALETPLVRLFGTSPKGMNATGESDLRNYYDNIKRKQENRLKSPIKTILELEHRSVFGKGVPAGTGFTFNSLWQMSEAEKSEIASRDTTSIVGAADSGIVSRAVALKELKQSGRTTGMWTNISDEDIKDAESEPPPSEFVPDPDDLKEQQNGNENPEGQEE